MDLTCSISSLLLTYNNHTEQPYPIFSPISLIALNRHYVFQYFEKWERYCRFHEARLSSLDALAASPNDLLQQLTDSDTDYKLLSQKVQTLHDQLDLSDLHKVKERQWLRAKKFLLSERGTRFGKPFCQFFLYLGERALHQMKVFTVKHFLHTTVHSTWIILMNEFIYSDIISCHDTTTHYLEKSQQDSFNNIILKAINPQGAGQCPLVFPNWLIKGSLLNEIKQLLSMS